MIPLDYIEDDFMFDLFGLHIIQGIVIFFRKYYCLTPKFCNAEIQQIKFATVTHNSDFWLIKRASNQSHCVPKYVWIDIRSLFKGLNYTADKRLLFCIVLLLFVQVYWFRRWICWWHTRVKIYDKSNLIRYWT